MCDGDGAEGTRLAAGFTSSVTHFTVQYVFLSAEPAPVVAGVEVGRGGDRRARSVNPERRQRSRALWREHERRRFTWNG